MILLIGQKGCNRCQMTKNILINKNIDFDYKLLNELSKEEQDKYLKMATEKQMFELRLIIKDNNLITLQEI